jgi:GTP-binding protein
MKQTRRKIKMAKPIVAIVGRPNVGKSTLFNKLAGKRISIVQDTPGVTRDRVYAEAEWLRYNFTMIDTGGIEPANDDIIVKQMRRQANIAIETADVIIFIVDGKEGLTASDNEVATMLRKSKKPVVLVVNKVDNLKDENNAYEFYNLGIGEPITISAGQGLGLGDMLDEVVKNFDKSIYETDDDEYIRIAMIGKPNVGKSSLINKLLGEERTIVSDIPGTTRDAIDSYLETEEGKFILVDTAGIRRKSKVKEEIERYSVIRTYTAIERADVCILMIDATDGVTEQDEKIIGYAHELRKAIMVIVNKWDLVEKDGKTLDKFKKELQGNLKFLSYAEYLFISALTGQRTNKVLTMAKYCYDNYNKRISTGILNDVISKAVLMKEPPTVALKRMKIYYATQVATKPPKFVFFVNDESARHFSYERYLENQLRNSFDFKGTGIQIEYRSRKE